MVLEGSSRVAVGIDAAIVADHQVTLRRPESGGPGVIVERFKVPSTIVGLTQLTERLSPFPGSVVVCEPTSMTWLSIQIAVERAGCEMSLIGTRHSARLRGALVGKHKSDVIDADMLSRAGEFFALDPTRRPTPDELALRRVVQLRHRRWWPRIGPIDGSCRWRRGRSLTCGDRWRRRGQRPLACCADGRTWLVCHELAPSPSQR